MAGIKNQHEAAARVRRVMAFDAAADHLVDKVAKGSLIDREIVLLAFIGRLEGEDGAAERTKAWQALGCVAGIRPVADKADGTTADQTETGKATLTALRAKLLPPRYPNVFAELAAQR